MLALLAKCVTNSAHRDAKEERYLVFTIMRDFELMLSYKKFDKIKEFLSLGLKRIDDFTITTSGAVVSICWAGRHNFPSEYEAFYNATRKLFRDKGMDNKRIANILDGLKP